MSSTLGVFRAEFEGSNDIGVFARLTNKYCLVAQSNSENFYSVFEEKLADHVPVIHATIGGNKIVGRLCVGNSNGLILPNSCSDQELQYLRDCLPDEIAVVRVDDRLSALGNTIACNDHVALIHPEIDPTTEEIIADVLGVEVFRQTIGNNPLVGACAAFTNVGGLVPPMTSIEEQDELATLMQIPIAHGTVNRGSDVLGGGLVVNDWVGYVGRHTTGPEINVVESIFGLNTEETTGLIGEDAKHAFIETL
ncbi:Translation initiation factor IF6 [Carpediemonas membranifera]|uniref:Eukaryotic translation initiation factor 6 n=1 Tax=Carpediemonas membranifera TaxID=201153 RepID=A0A8J6B2M4_9EUKA|nr:Translation initiation factor IF6 [Carpediemonas membranifera]|eukprot:KAG9391667.1 Translation initiation factor IF6 [Carpediemonas membranifera]